jgi:hypothetical protein
VTPTISYYTYTLGTGSTQTLACSDYWSSPNTLYAPSSGGTGINVGEIIYQDAGPNPSNPAIDGYYSDGYAWFQVSGGTGLIVSSDPNGCVGLITPSVTPTNTPTPSITATITPTKSVTPTKTPTPTTTPPISSVTLCFDYDYLSVNYTENDVPSGVFSGRSYYVLTHGVVWSDNGVYWYWSDTLGNTTTYYDRLYNGSQLTPNSSSYTWDNINSSAGTQFNTSLIGSC